MFHIGLNMARGNRAGGCATPFTYGHTHTHHIAHGNYYRISGESEQSESAWKKIYG